MSKSNEQAIETEETVTKNTKPIKEVREKRVTAVKDAAAQRSKDIQLERQQRGLVSVYRNEKKVPVTISPSYAKHFGRVMRVSINGVSIAVRCNGQTVQLPESFATEVMRRIKEVDAIEFKQQRMADTSSNFDGGSPGFLSFF